MTEEISLRGVRVQLRTTIADIATGEIVGLIRLYEEEDPDYASASIWIPVSHC